MLRIVKGRPVERAQSPPAAVKAQRSLWAPYTVNDLPGVQVIVSAYNCEPWLSRFLESLERAMRGLRWVFLAADDGSGDRTHELLQDYASTVCTADRAIVEQFEKAANVSIAKNRVVRMGFPFREQYPAIALCDADDEVGENRIHGLLGAALRGGHLSLAGDFLRERDGRQVYHRGSDLTYGPPMTLFHEALLPWNGTLFDETFHNHGDWAQQAEWRARGIHTEIVPGVMTNVHVYHPLSVSSNLTPEQVLHRTAKLDEYKAGLAKRKLVSFCTTCMGRLHHLKQTLPFNLNLCRDFADVEFCLVNYNSQDGMDEWVRGEMARHLVSGKLKYHHTTEPKEFQHGRAKNMAHRLGEGFFLVNVDADNFLTPEYLRGLMGEIATGAEVVHFPGEARSWGGGFGRVAVRQDLFWSVGGYDETHFGWGADDWDLMKRAEAVSRRAVRLLDPRCLKYIEHADAERVVNLSQKNKHDSNAAWYQHFSERIKRGELVANQQGETNKGKGEG